MHVAGRRGMSYGFVGEAMLFVPGGRGAVQIGCSLATLVLQANPQQVGEQLVVAPPPAFFVQGDQEEPAASSRSSVSCPSVRPVRASHAGPQSLSSTDVSSRKLTTSSVCRASTSSVR